MLAEEFVIDTRLVVKSFQKSRGDELDEVAVAFEIFAEKNKVIAAAGAGLKIIAIVGVHRAGFFAAIVAATLGDINFAADDGLHIALAGFVKEIGGGKEVAVIGDGHRRHFLAGSFVEELGGFTRSIQETVISVYVQVNELRITHGILL
jgi:hypothetical protein